MTSDAFCGGCGKPRPTKPVPHCNKPHLHLVALQMLHHQHTHRKPQEGLDP